MDYILLSGGLDSAALAFNLVKGEGVNLGAIYIDHGQRAAAKELASSHAIATALGIPLKTIDVSGMWPSFRDIAEPTHVHIMTSAAIGSSPGIGIAAAYAAMAGARKIYLGLVKEDIDGRPWLLDLLKSYESAVRCVRPSLTGFPPGNVSYSDFAIEAPAANTSKNELIERACKLGAPLQNTWSCQFSNIEQCGVCYICKLRKLAFSKSGVMDATVYTA